MPQYWVAPFMADSSHVRYTVKGLNFHQTPCSLAKTPGCSGVPAVCCFMVSFSKECQPLINNPLGCLIGRVPFKYLIMAIDYWRSTPLINKPWFINPGLTLLYIYIYTSLGIRILLNLPGDINKPISTVFIFINKPM